MTFALITSFHCSITTPISRIFSIILPLLIHLETLNFLRTDNIDFIDDWPANSPDLNPIEHVWDSLRRYPNPPANVYDLRQALIQEWNNIPQAEINTSQFYTPAMHYSGQFKRWSYPLLSGFFLITPTTLGQTFSNLWPLNDASWNTL